MIGEMEPLYPESRVREIAESAAHKAIDAAFIRMGIDIKDPVRMQRQFLLLEQMSDDDERIEDNLFTRRLRKRCESWAVYFGMALILIVLGAISTLVGLGFRSATGVFPPPPTH